MSQITEYNATEAGLAELRQRYAGIAFDLTSTKGDKEARAARKELVTLRTSLEAKRKELKAPALEHARLIDAEAARIKGEIEALECPIDAQIKADEARRERERQEKAEREAQRVAGHQAAVQSIRSIPVNAVGFASEKLRAVIGSLEETTYGDEMEEFQPLAERAKADALGQLQALLTKAEAAEAEAKRLAEERAELERQRAEQARIAAEAEKRRQQEEAAAAEARRQAEAAAAEQRRAQEAEAVAAKAKMEAEAREARERIERQEREARERIAEQERKAKAERDAAEAAARAAREAQEALERAQRRAEEDRLRAEREAAEARQREAEEAARKVREAEEAAQAEKRHQAQLRLDARTMLETFVERFGSVPEYEDIARDIAVFLHGQTQLSKVAA